MIDMLALHSHSMAEVAELASLDREIGSESEDASDSSGSRAEVTAACHFENTQYAESCRDRSDDTIDAVMARLAPSIRKHVEEALLPLVSALRSREQNEQKHRKKLLGLEMEKLVLGRKRLLFKQRRVAPCPAPYTISPRSKRHKDGVKKNPPTKQQDQAVGNSLLGPCSLSLSLSLSDQCCVSIIAIGYAGFHQVRKFS